MPDRCTLPRPMKNAGSILDQDLVFVDLETTGGSAGWDRIIEVGLCRVSGGELVEEWSSLVNPERSIPPFIERYTGITGEMVAEAPLFADLCDDLLQRLEGAVLIAHNARFDYGFLRSEFERLGICFEAPVLCTVRLSRRLFPQYRHHNLDAIMERYGLSCEARHRALGDARVLWDYLCLMRREVPEETVETSVRVLLKIPTLPPQLPPGSLDGLPPGPGVYLFYGEGERLLYVGKSVRLRSRILTHFAAESRNKRDMLFCREVRRVEARETAGELGALLLEAALVRRDQPEHNRRRLKSERLCAWRLTPVSSPSPPELVSLETPGEKGWEGLYGPFRTRRQALKALQELVREHDLCPIATGVEEGEGPCSGEPQWGCKGACTGEESPRLHHLRLLSAFAPLKMRSWPYPGPVAIREEDPSGRCELHLVHHWCHLGTAGSEEELQALLCDLPQLSFNPEIYTILTRHMPGSRVERLEPGHRRSAQEG